LNFRMQRYDPYAFTLTVELGGSAPRLRPWQGLLEIFNLNHEETLPARRKEIFYVDRTLYIES
jgi:hypothetical protein